MRREPWAVVESFRQYIQSLPKAQAEALMMRTASTYARIASDSKGAISQKMADTLVQVGYVGYTEGMIDG